MTSQQMVYSSPEQELKIAAEKTLESLVNRHLDLDGNISERNIHLIPEEIRQHVGRMGKKGRTVTKTKSDDL